MSASIEVRISSHYVSLKKAVVTTRIRADRRLGIAQPRRTHSVSRDITSDPIILVPSNIMWTSV